MKIKIAKIKNDSTHKPTKKNTWNFDQPDPNYQPDLFEPYTRNEQTRQIRQNPASYKNKFQSESPTNTQNY